MSFLPLDAGRTRMILDWIAPAWIATAPASEQSDALIKLSVLSDLRGIGPRVQSEVEKMGLPVNLEESTLLRGTFDRVRTETSIDDILEVLEARFPGALPADLKQRLADLGRDELKDALRRSATAASVEEALAKPSGTTHGR
jgi:hypothetical protein